MRTLSCIKSIYREYRLRGLCRRAIIELVKTIGDGASRICGLRGDGSNDVQVASGNVRFNASDRVGCIEYPLTDIYWQQYCGAFDGDDGLNGMHEKSNIIRKNRFAERNHIKFKWDLLPGNRPLWPRDQPPTGIRLLFYCIRPPFQRHLQCHREPIGYYFEPLQRLTWLRSICRSNIDPPDPWPYWARHRM